MTNGEWEWNLGFAVEDGRFIHLESGSKKGGLHNCLIPRHSVLCSTEIVCIYIYIYIHIYTHICVCVYVHIYVYTIFYYRLLCLLSDAQGCLVHNSPRGGGRTAPFCATVKNGQRLHASYLHFFLFFCIDTRGFRLYKMKPSLKISFCSTALATAHLGAAAKAPALLHHRRQRGQRRLQPGQGQQCHSTGTKCHLCIIYIIYNIPPPSCH